MKTLSYSIESNEVLRHKNQSLQGNSVNHYKPRDNISLWVAQNNVSSSEKIVDIEFNKAEVKYILFIFKIIDQRFLFPLLFFFFTFFSTTQAESRYYSNFSSKRYFTGLIDTWAKPCT